MDNIINSLISIIIPTYNEEKGIAAVLDNLQYLDDNYEVIVVNDGSNDNTYEIVKKCSHVRLINHEQNSGYGAALKTGIKSAKGDVVVIMDADGTYPDRQIPDLVRTLNEGDY